MCEFPEKALKRALALLEGAGGTLDRTALLRKLKIDAITFKKLILTLEMCNLIEAEQVERDKIMYSIMAA